MKHLFALGTLIILIAACGSSTKNKKKVDKDALFGSFAGEKYANPFFNISMDFNEQWKIDSTSFQTSFGGVLVEADYLASENTSYPANIVLETNKANPFAPPSVVGQAKESVEGYEMLLDPQSLIKKPFYKREIAGEEYLVNEIAILEGVDTSFIHEYYRYVDNYFLSIVCIANSGKDNAAITDFVNGIQKLK